MMKSSEAASTPAIGVALKRLFRPRQLAMVRFRLLCSARNRALRISSFIFLPLLCLLPSTKAHAQVAWVASSNLPLAPSEIVAGPYQSSTDQIELCRVTLKDDLGTSMWPGSLIKGTCYSSEPYDTRDWPDFPPTYTEYDVATIQSTPGQWKPYTGQTHGIVIGGWDTDGTPNYVCRASLSDIYPHLGIISQQVIGRIDSGECYLSASDSPNSIPGKHVPPPFDIYEIIGPPSSKPSIIGPPSWPEVQRDFDTQTIDLPKKGGGSDLILEVNQAQYKASDDGIHVAWIHNDSGDPLPSIKDEMLLGGHNNNPSADLYVCRTALNNATTLADLGIHPGKLIGGKCNVSYGGGGNAYDNYEVAILTGDQGHWGAFDSAKTDHMLLGGHEANGTPLYVCQANFSEQKSLPMHVDEHGMQLGKLVEGACFFEYGSHEAQSSQQMAVYYLEPPPPPPPPKGPSCGIPGKPACPPPPRQCSIPPHPMACGLLLAPQNYPGKTSQCQTGFHGVCEYEQCTSDHFTFPKVYCAPGP
jgi:hypothetical protein